MGKFIKLYNDSIEPCRGTIAAAGYDLYAHEFQIIPAHGRKLVKIGVACEMARNEYLAIVPRSGLALKQGITVLNTPGTVDADYYPNEIGVILFNTTDVDFKVDIGDRIAQAILHTYDITDNDNFNDIERTSGFGSTGTK